MLSAADFLPSYMTEFMNFVMMTFPNLGSEFTSRFSAEWRRDISSLPSSWPGSSRPSTSQLFDREPRVSLRSPGDEPRYARLTSDASRRTSNGAAYGS